MRLIRLKEVIQMTGLARATIYKYMASGSFPPSVSLGPKLVAWVEEEIEEWISTRISERDFNKIEC